MRPHFLHGKLLRSTMLLTDDAGAPATGGAGQRVTYTAFGEAILCASGAPAAGGFGYQSGRTKTRYAARYGAVAGGDPNLPGADAPYSDLLTLKGANPALPAISMQHLGHRWYDPAMGRFLQRDPMGIRGGMNVYAYCIANPLTQTDPRGLVADTELCLRMRKAPLLRLPRSHFHFPSRHHRRLHSHARECGRSCPRRRGYRP